ncbi:cysteine-rich RLK (RECEPTOR-like protein kinase) 8 [Hibiscus trionum]|uniref:Cysteine-rich RLK (RECEPTOR-like protein kinase) 8 n=1 Tax=Hibiscus trionum TaxID=183268 RepID=A0A9W7LSE7_HIBTR|nr:cysteine-rich RLK (RECEPTOR-like protein kinase) 8 [Hibiscus trionum]
MCSTKKLTSNAGSPISDSYMYRSLVGALLYVCHTRPDIAFSVHHVAQFMHRPCEEHLVAVKQILRYLVGTLDYGLTFTSCDSGSLLGARGSRNLSLVRRPKHKYQSVADVVSELLWVQTVLTDMQISLLGPPVVWCDNKSAVAMYANPVFHSKSKHVELDVHFVREKVCERKIQVNYVHAEAQVADGFTKPLSKVYFHNFRHKVVVHPIDVSCV